MKNIISDSLNYPARIRLSNQLNGAQALPSLVEALASKHLGSSFHLLVRAEAENFSDI